MATDTPSTLEGLKGGDKPTDLNNVWSLRINGSSNMNGSGASVILESLMREKINYALKLEFPTSKNEVEYEALLSRLQLARERRVEQLKIYSDS